MNNIEITKNECIILLKNLWSNQDELSTMFKKYSEYEINNFETPAAIFMLYTVTVMYDGDIGWVAEYRSNQESYEEIYVIAPLVSLYFDKREHYEIYQEGGIDALCAYFALKELGSE